MAHRCPHGRLTGIGNGIAGVAPVKRDIARGIARTPKNWYTNLHTTKFGDGAVRGRLRSAHGSW
ncbi:CHRD domain-containing protein [Sphaerisporangium perillae]|uniref:CHRD domain-containing protein n=1 Tax=Sphaerisporangium perillae TaxID=2935860 RepID=UPI00200E8D8A|nr:CHRD domain-containing protein [Sphaerisporangium perillae]